MPGTFRTGDNGALPPTPPWTLDDALAHVRAEMRGVAFREEMVIAYPWGWAMTPTSHEHARSGNILDQPVGYGPLLIESATGTIHHCASGAPATFWAKQLGRRLRGDAWWRPASWRRCACFLLPLAFSTADEDRSWRRSLEPVDTARWMRLERCRRCGAWWAIDEEDRYARQAAFRLPGRDDWAAAAEQARRGLLIREHGGTVDERCAWRACDQRRLQDVAVCVDHLTHGAQRGSQDAP